MSKEILLRVSPEVAFSEELLTERVKQKLRNPEMPYHLVKRSIDARGKQVQVNLQIGLGVEMSDDERRSQFDYQNVAGADPVVIVGSGPAGLFAALRLIELGIKPVIFERGKDVRKRRRDIAAINKDHIVNPDSNYCFGEGGAGTYSDGKLYTRSKKRGDIQRVLDILVNHGASNEILIDAHPHIGTNKLPQIIQEVRATILSHGGEIHFESRVVDFVINDDEMSGVILSDGQQHDAIGVILATGHSARDIFEILHAKGVTIEAKPFAIGVRVEHSQKLIDQIQYHCRERGPYLPASPYSVSYQTMYKGKRRGVFSFCMCPGGFIVPSATDAGEIVVNGMSPSRRDSKYANSGIVAAVELEDLDDFEQHGVLAALAFQKSIEQKAFESVSHGQTAPAQRLVDFVKGRVSSSLLPTSYQPGLSSVDLATVLPESITDRLRQGFRAFGKRMKGYYTNEAQIIGVESRTSSPIKIPRDKDTCQHIQIKRFFPCGEGAGYAGGIVSAAMDGERCAEQLVKLYSKSEK